MKKHLLYDPAGADRRVTRLTEAFARKIHTCPPGVCPLTVQRSLLQASCGNTCGKCVPCRDGLPQLEAMLEMILDGRGTEQTLSQMETLAKMIRDTADCAIGYQAAEEVLRGMEIFHDEYQSHIERQRCTDEIGQTVPCVTMCPAHVDIPGYIALVAAGDYAGAVAMVRKDNPFPTACAMICEHPCEERCRRNLIDDKINIRAIKKFAVDQAASDQVPVPACGVSTGKKVAVVGGGPSGMTAAYFLALMGHKVVVYEGKEKLGGMLRYGIPNYRFPKDRLDEDLRGILKAGDIEIRCGIAIGKDLPLETLRTAYDACYLAIGAQAGKTLHLEGIDSEGVEPAVELLDKIGHGELPDYTGKRVVVVGGGNVAMDCARSAVRCHAAEVQIVYRRRKEDMTALQSEIESAMEEGVVLDTLMAPERIEVNEQGHCTALWVQPQLVGPFDKDGRPKPVKADLPQKRIACDVILIAVGQDIDSAVFAEAGVPVERNCMQAKLDCSIPQMPGVFAGGDCVTGPATVIRAIAAGKVAAYNIDEYLGYHHKVACDVTSPAAKENNRIPTGRVNLTERPAAERKCDFAQTENPMRLEEALQEAGRCLRCDHFGCGVLEGGSVE
jgi:NADPH-dependent glutamate synthase beta subunit-like oxidoreductase